MKINEVPDRVWDCARKVVVWENSLNWIRKHALWDVRCDDQKPFFFFFSLTAWSHSHGCHKSPRTTICCTGPLHPNLCFCSIPVRPKSWRGRGGPGLDERANRANVRMRFLLCWWRRREVDVACHGHREWKKGVQTLLLGGSFDRKCVNEKRKDNKQGECLGRWQGRHPCCGFLFEFSCQNVAFPPPLILSCCLLILSVPLWSSPKVIEGEQDQGLLWRWFQDKERGVCESVIGWSTTMSITSNNTFLSCRLRGPRRPSPSWSRAQPQ